jgi:hypothetical protein
MNDAIWTEKFKDFYEFIFTELKSELQTGVNEVIFENKSVILWIINFVHLLHSQVKSLHLLAELTDQYIGTVCSLSKFDDTTLDETIYKVEIADLRFIWSQNIFTKLLVWLLHLNLVFRLVK